MIITTVPGVTPTAQPATPQAGVRMDVTKIINATPGSAAAAIRRGHFYATHTDALSLTRAALAAATPEHADAV